LLKPSGSGWSGKSSIARRSRSESIRCITAPAGSLTSSRKPVGILSSWRTLSNAVVSRRGLRHLLESPLGHARPREGPHLAPHLVDAAYSPRRSRRSFSSQSPRRRGRGRCMYPRGPLKYPIAERDMRTRLGHQGLDGTGPSSFAIGTHWFSVLPVNSCRNTEIYWKAKPNRGEERTPSPWSGRGIGAKTPSRTPVIQASDARNF